MLFMECVAHSFFIALFNYGFNDTDLARQYNSGMTQKEVRSVKEMIPRDKMSKKARKALAREKRIVWLMNPATRVRESGKVYDRNRYRQHLGD